MIATCIKTDPLQALIVGRFYKIELINGKYSIPEINLVLDEERFKEHFADERYSNTRIYNYKTDNKELLPCPFCGSRPVWYLIGNDRTKKHTIVVKCSNTYCRAEQRTGGVRTDIETCCEVAKSIWNNRTEKGG